ncbi:MAG: cellulase family glycosylhydrolase [Anaerolineaceae bacterium]|nr:cellulase family glycosylhydrolase [Anaerolineaceae bacterium]
MVRIHHDSFTDEQGRRLMLRGVNLGGSSKVPRSPDGSTYQAKGFFDHREVSFVGRPFSLEEADEHYRRLRSWGFNTLRFLFTWEAVEHAGPGLYDEGYLDYLHAIVKKAGEFGFLVFLDPHQDVWSRFSGGDGAPGWTLEAAGFDLTKFQETGAAIVHQTHGDPFPRMIWPTNAYKLAAATMFTLFFAGKDFAPATRVEGHQIQDYLQEHYFSMIRTVVNRMQDLDCVIGYDVFNEPQKGFIGHSDLRIENKALRLGPTPTPWQAILLGAGIPQQISTWSLSLPGFPLHRKVLMNPNGTRVWLPGKACVWQENGVWDFDAKGEPRLIHPDYFARIKDHDVEFSQDYLVPFTRQFAETVHAIDSDALIFMENEVDDPAPRWLEAPQHQIVYAPHWYDGFVLFTKRFIPWLGTNVRSRRLVLGKRMIHRSYANQMGLFKREAREKLGGVPVLIGEIGIPFDLERKIGYHSGNFSIHALAMDRSMKALEKNLLNTTIWNYTSDNDNVHGDQWNDEDLSIFSPDQRNRPEDINSGGRGLAAVVRPYPIATAGIPQYLNFNFLTGHFEYGFKTTTETKAPTRLFIPRLHYPHGITVQLSDGAYQYDEKNQLLEYTPGNLDLHIISIKPIRKTLL